MKYLIILMISLLTFTSCNSKEKPNDLKEYGYLGDVKKVTAKRYSDLLKQGDSWVVNEDKITLKTETNFNKNGNIFKVIYFLLTDGGSWEEHTSSVKFKNGLKDSYVILDSNKNTIVSGQYVWADDMNYKENSETNDGVKITSYSKLNKSYRDLSGRYQYLFNDSIIVDEVYSNKLSSNGEVLSSDNVDHAKNISYTIIRKSLEKDSIGNSTLFVLEFESSGKLKYLETREFEYYE